MLIVLRFFQIFALNVEFILLIQACNECKQQHTIAQCYFSCFYTHSTNKKKHKMEVHIHDTYREL